MTCHDMSSNVTMLNWKTFHDIWWNVFQFNMVTFHDIWWYLVTLHDIWWYLVTFQDKTCRLSWYIMTFHDMSWYDPFWFREVDLLFHSLHSHRLIENLKTSEWTESSTLFMLLRIPIWQIKTGIVWAYFKFWSLHYNKKSIVPWNAFQKTPYLQLRIMKFLPLMPPQTAV